DPHVHLDGGPTADAGEGAVLEDVQELRLERRMEVADLVEEDRASVGELELPRPGLVRAGEGAPFVTEELRLEELARHRGAVHLHVGLRPAGRELVDRPGDEVLPGPRL